jgi:hypothetical protein
LRLLLKGACAQKDEHEGKKTKRHEGLIAHISSFFSSFSFFFFITFARIIITKQYFPYLCENKIVKS